MAKERVAVYNEIHFDKAFVVIGRAKKRERTTLRRVQHLRSNPLSLESSWSDRKRRGIDSE